MKPSRRQRYNLPWLGYWGCVFRRIVIDAGQVDTIRNIGPDGIEEKDIALDVALRLGHLFAAAAGCEVIYTRRTDKYVSWKNAPRLQMRRTPICFFQFTPTPVPIRMSAA